MIPNKPLSDSENEASATSFLQTNGPPKSVSEVDPDFEALLRQSNLSELDKESHRTQHKMAKQIGWMVPQVVGLKGAHRVIHTRMDTIKSDLVEEIKKTDAKADALEIAIQPLTASKRRWDARQKIVRNVLIGAVSLLLEEWVRHFFSAVKITH